MAASQQYERDIRSANQEWKRTKDSAAKWSHGSRHLPGISLDIWGEIRNGANISERQFAKSRPNKKHSEM
jgi:hypothetical protein